MTSVSTEIGPRTEDRLAEKLRGFGPLGVLAILIILVADTPVTSGGVMLPIGAALVLVWVRASRTPWREIGYVRPVSWLGSVALGIAVGIAFKVLMKAIVMPLLGAPPINQAFHHLAGNSALLPAAVWAMFAAGFGEETLFRGFMFERLGKLLGSGAGAKASIVVLTSVWFGLGHYAGQGLAGAEQGMIVGLVFGTIVARTGRLWTVMWAHTAFDLTALAIIYWNLESDIAHLVF
jgi:membrane protease YdiL (CAAX protease family)